MRSISIDIEEFHAAADEWRALHDQAGRLEPCDDGVMDAAVSAAIAARRRALAPLAPILRQLSELMVSEAAHELNPAAQQRLIERMSHLASLNYGLF